MRLFLAFYALSLAACCGGGSKPTPASTTVGTRAPEAPVAPAPAPSAPAVAVPTYKDLGVHKMHEEMKRNILVAPGTSEAQLVALARQLHAEAPQQKVHIFDDDKEFKAYREWALHDVEKTKDPRYPYPEKWVEQHEVGVVRIVVLPTTPGKPYAPKWCLDSYPSGQGSAAKHTPLE